MLFTDFENDHAREQLVAIAQQRATLLRPEGRELALGWVLGAFELWKRGRADPDGTIELPAQTLGLLGLGKATSRRLSIDEVNPEECGGPNVRCAFDLLMHLYGERYPEIMKVADKLPLDFLAALLVVRDYRTMPMSALGFAVRFIWEIADINRRAYVATIGEKDSKRAKQYAEAREKAFLKKAQNSRVREDTIERLGIEFFQRHTNGTNSEAAARIYAQVKNTKEFSGMTEDGVRRKLAGVKGRAVALLAAKAR